MKPMRSHSLALALAAALAADAAPCGETGAPWQVHDRAAIERSGAFTLAEFLRSLPLDPFGSFRPRGQTTQRLSLQALSLQGLGRERTLILVDGRPLPVTSADGHGQNLATIPLAMVERIEVRGPSAGAPLGSIDIVLRRLAEGGETRIGAALPESAGADRRAASALIGAGNDRGRWSLGVAHERLDAVEAGDRDWIPSIASSRANNFLPALPGSGLSFLRHPMHGSAVPGGCSEANFSLVGTGTSTRCVYDPNAVADSEPALRTTSLHLAAEHALAADWTARIDLRAAKVTGDALLAPTAVDPLLRNYIPVALIPAGSPNHPAVRFPDQGYDPALPLYLYHRTVAIGPRSVEDAEQQRDFAIGLDGRIGAAEVGIEARHAQSRSETLLRRQIALEPFRRAIADGSYDIYHPGANSPAVLAAIAPDSLRETRYERSGMLASAQWSPGELAAGPMRLRAHAEFLGESWLDTGADPRHEALGRMLGARDVTRNQLTLGTQLELPLHADWTASLALSQDHYDTSGGESSGGIALEWRPGADWRFTASHDLGFIAPTLDLVDFAPVLEPVNLSFASFCLLGTDFAGLYICPPPPKLSLGAVPGALVPNPELDPERVAQSRIGLRWQPDARIDLAVELWDVRIEDRIVLMSPDQVVACAFGSGAGCPAGISRFTQDTPPTARIGLGARRLPEGGNGPYVQNGWSNFGRVETSGIDMRIGWNAGLAGGGLRSELAWQWLARFKVDGVDRLDMDDFAGNDAYPRPRSQARLDTQWERGGWSLAWQVVHVAGAQSAADVLQDPDYPSRLPSSTVHDVQLRWRTPWRGEVALGVRNLFDRAPPLDPYEGYAFALHDGSGRTPYLQLRQRW